MYKNSYTLLTCRKHTLQTTMPGPYDRSVYSNPEIGWIISFNPESNLHRVSRIEGNQFWTEAILPIERDVVNWNDMVTLDNEDYGKSGQWEKSAYGNPVIGQYVYAFNSLHRVTFVGRYTMDMVDYNEDTDMEYN